MKKKIEAKKKTKATMRRVSLPILMLRMVVQVEDTAANRTALSVAKARLLRDSIFDGAQNAVKMEQMAVISLCKPKGELSK